MDACLYRSTKLQGWDEFFFGLWLKPDSSLKIWIVGENSIDDQPSAS